MRYGSLARSLWFVVGVAVIQALQPALARAQTASDNADAPARKSSSAPSSSAREVRRSGAILSNSVLATPPATGTCMSCLVK
jgi:hypothetical protein